MRTLLKLEEAKEGEEARAFAEQRRLLDEKQAKLKELEGYLREYNQRFTDHNRAGTSVEQLRSDESWTQHRRHCDTASHQQ